MDKSIYVVSRCLQKKDENFQFHFIGYFDGQRVETIYVNGGDFENGEDYLLFLEGVYCIGPRLFGSLIKSKKIFT